MKFGRNVAMNKKNLELVTVVIPCFNSGNTIERTINSIRNQSWKNYEIIVVNDGSTDLDTINKLSLLEKDVRLINQNNLGLPSARNTGFREAKGKFILPLDADDWIEPKTIEIMYEKLLKFKNASYVFSDISLEGKFKNVIKNEFNFFEQLFLNKIPYSIFIPKELWDKVSGYDETFRDGYEDWEFNIRLGNKGFYGTRVNKALFHYNVNSEGMLISKSSKLHIKIWLKIIEKNFKIYKYRNLFFTWLKWRNYKSEFPLFVYFFWITIVKLIPKKMSLFLFLKMRDIKWFFARS